MRRLCLSFLIVIAATPDAFAQGTMTLDATLARVWRENPTIVAAEHDLRATEELYPQARSGWLPTLDADANITSTRVESGNFTQGDGATTKGAAINFEQPVFRGFRTTARTDAARERIAAGSARLREVQQDICLDMVERYMDVIRDRFILSLQQRNADLLSEETLSVTARFEAGDLTRTDMRQTEARASNARAEVAIAQSRLRESEAAFERLAGFAPGAVMEMPEPDFGFPDDIDGLIATAAARNPALERARHSHEAAEDDIVAARADYYPQVTAFASHLKEYDPQPGLVEDSETSAIGMRARISLYQGGNTLSRVREAKSRASQRFSETVALERSVRAAILADWQRLSALDVEIDARQMQVSAARFSREGVREEARLGERTVLDTLDAEQDILAAERALAQASRDRIVTAYRLAAALGLLEPGTAAAPAGTVVAGTGE